jgi:hypothetical protein
MPIDFACPACKTKMRAADYLAGRTLRCGKCRASFVVPAAVVPTRKPAGDLDRLLAANDSESIFGE